MSTSTEVVQRSPQQELVAQIRTDEFRSQLSLALPENVTPERFVRVAVTALQANEDIATFERGSVLRSLLQSAAMGLLPDGREAAIVGYSGKAQLIPMIGGFRKIAGEYGWTIYTAIAYANDAFEYEQGLDVRFRHVPVRPGADRGEPIAAYAVGRHADGRRELEVLTVAEVEKVRKVSRASGRGPWVDWWEQMAEKTAGRRLFKKLPLSEDDKRVRILSAAAIEPGDATTALYGESVDRDTGELLPSPTPQAAESVSGIATDSATPAPADSAAPGEEDGEPSLEDELGATVIPSTKQKDKTLDEVAEIGPKGWEWLAWACEDARPWHREEHPHAAFGKAVREYVARASQAQA